MLYHSWPKYMLDFPFIGRKDSVHSLHQAHNGMYGEGISTCLFYALSKCASTCALLLCSSHARLLSSEWTNNREGLLLNISADAGSGAGRVLAPLSNESNIICDFNEKNCTSIWKGGAVLLLMLGITAPLSVTLWGVRVSARPDLRIRCRSNYPNDL